MEQETIQEGIMRIMQTTIGLADLVEMQCPKREEDKRFLLPFLGDWINKEISECTEVMVHSLLSPYGRDQVKGAVEVAMKYALVGVMAYRIALHLETITDTKFLMVQAAKDTIDEAVRTMGDGHGCDGSACDSPVGEVRRYPMNSGQGAYLCRKCYDEFASGMRSMEAVIGRAFTPIPWEELVSE